MQGIEALVEAPETCSVRPSRRSWGTAGEQETGRRGSAPRERQRGGALSRSCIIGAVRFWTHDRFTFPLPPGHRFPMPKYRLLREAVEADGHTVQEARAVSWADL